MTAYVLIIVALILANGLFAMAEISLVSSRRTRLQQMADDGSVGAQVALNLSSSPGRFLATIQINVTLIGIVTGAAGEATLARALEPSLTDVPVIGLYSSVAAAVIVIVAISYVTLVIGELAPKRLGLTYSERIASALAPLMKMLSVVAAPAVWVLDRSERLVTAPFRGSSSPTDDINREEIIMLMDQWSRSGVLNPTELELVDGLMELRERRVESILKPRPDVYWLEVNTEPEELRKALHETRYTVLPVAQTSFDDVLGTVRARDLLLRMVDGEEPDLREQLDEPLFISSWATALELLEALGERNTHMAVAMDEHGVPEGIVTLTDVMQVIVGPLAPLSEGYTSRLETVEPERWVVDAMISLDEFEERIGMEIPLDDRAHFQTVAGLVLKLSEDIPDEGETVRYRELTIQVDRMDGQRIDQVIVERETASEGDADPLEGSTEEDAPDNA